MDDKVKDKKLTIMAGQVRRFGSDGDLYVILPFTRNFSDTINVQNLATGEKFAYKKMDAWQDDLVS